MMQGNPRPTDDGSDYDSNSIKVLKGLEAVRKRPGMYIGDTSDGTGLHHMVFEVLDNAIDEALAGYCDDIKVVIHADNSVSIVDNYRGFITSRWMTNSARRRTSHRVHAGGSSSELLQGLRRLHGVGVSVVNGLSEWLERRSGAQGAPDRVPRRRRCRSARGDRHKLSGAAPRYISIGSDVRNVEYHYDILARRIRELSFLNNGVKIELVDQRDGKSENFAFTGGIKALSSI